MPHTFSKIKDNIQALSFFCHVSLDTLSKWLFLFSTLHIVFKNFGKERNKFTVEEKGSVRSRQAVGLFMGFAYIFFNGQNLANFKKKKILKFFYFQHLFSYIMSNSDPDRKYMQKTTQKRSTKRCCNALFRV